MKRFLYYLGFNHCPKCGNSTGATLHVAPTYITKWCNQCGWENKPIRK